LVVLALILALAPFFWKRLDLDFSRGIIIIVAAIAPLGLMVYKFPQFLPLAFLPFVPLCFLYKFPGWQFFLAALLFLVGILTSFFYAQLVGGRFAFGYWDLWVPATMLMGASVSSWLVLWPKGRKLYFKAYIVSNALLAVIVLIACLAVGGLESVLGSRLGTLIGLNPNIFAGILDVAFPVTFSMGVSRCSTREGKFMLAAGALDLLDLLLTQSRGSLLALFACGLLLVAFFCHRNPRFIGIVLLGGLLLAAPMTAYMVRIVGMKNPESSISNLGRIVLLQKVRKVLVDQHYAYGIGMDNFSQVKMDYGFTRWFDPKAQMSSHDIHLEFLLGWGLFGLIGWLFTLTVLTVSLFRQGARGDWLAMGGAMAVIAISVHGFVDSLLILPLYFVNICILFGALMAYPRPSLASKQDELITPS